MNMALRLGLATSCRFARKQAHGTLPRVFRVARCSSAVSDANLQLPVKDKKLFTPGPLGTSFDTKKVMMRDVGSRDEDFVNCVQFIRRKLLEVAGASPKEYTVIPVQGSGTYSIESVLTTATPRDSNAKLLIVVSGAYGKRMVKICEIAGINAIVLDGPEDQKADVHAVEKVLQENPDLSGVCIVHCETTSGVIHPVEAVGKLVHKYTPNAFFFVDAMSSFGAIPLNLENARVSYMVSSANKCIEGVPGFSYIIANTAHLMKCKGQARTLSLDFVDQYEVLEKTGQFRFTPPTQSMLAFRKALQELDEEGGVVGRAERYMDNRHILRDGMRKFGFKEFLDDTHEGYIITSFHYPKHPNFDFSDFYKRLSEKNQVIYPGKVTKTDCFRIGNIGYLFPKDMEYLLSCIEEVMKDMNIPLPLEEQ